MPAEIVMKAWILISSEYKEMREKDTELCEIGIRPKYCVSEARVHRHMESRGGD